MSDIADTDLTFKGRTPGGLSCEEFVKAVRRHAVTEKKSRDNEYIADYAMSWLSDDALHWSETLSEEVQGDWSLLRRALLAEYGSWERNIARALPSLPNAIVPVPAAAPPIGPPMSGPSLAFNPSQNIRGRIKVTAPGFTGYLSKHLDNGSTDHTKWMCRATSDVSEACVLSGTTGNDGLQFKFENLDHPFSDLGRHLGIVWKLANPIPAARHYAAVTAIDFQGSIASSKKSTFWKGPIIWVTWSRSPDNALTPKLDGMPEAGIAIGGRHIEIAASLDAFTETYSNWKKAHFTFESI